MLLGDEMRKFRVGDRVRHWHSNSIGRVDTVSDKYIDIHFKNGSAYTIPIEHAYSALTVLLQWYHKFEAGIAHGELFLLPTLWLHKERHTDIVIAEISIHWLSMGARVKFWRC